MVWTIIIIILSVADQLIKLVINRNLTATDRISVIEGFFYIIRRENSGAAWSFLAGRDWGIYLLIVMSLLMTALLVWLLAHIRHIGLSLCLSLIIAGASATSLTVSVSWLSWIILIFISAAMFFPLSISPTC